MFSPRLLAVFVAINTFIGGGLAWLTGTQRSYSTFFTAWRVLTLNEGAKDSWGPMGEALAFLRSGQAGGVYTQLLPKGIKFQYPLSSLLPFSTLPDVAASPQIVVIQSGVLINRFGLAALIAFTAMLLRNQFKDLGRYYWPLGIATFAVLTFFPITWAFTIGQIQIWIDMFFTAAVLAWATSRKEIAGLLIAFAALIKPQYALFLLWGAARREWRFVVAFVAVVTIGLLSSIVTYGLSQNLDYLNALKLLSRGEAYFPNQSLNGLSNRILTLWQHNSDLISRNDFARFNLVIFWGTALTSAAIIISVILIRGRETIVDFCAIGIALTMASPIAWEHHYGVLLPAYVVASATFRYNIRALIWLAISYMLTSIPWTVTNMSARMPWNFIQSYVFFGALILLATLIFYSGTTESKLTAR